MPSKKPIWIVVDDGNMFDGHQAHWADCFFSNATRTEIEHAIENDPMLTNTVIREMEPEEVDKYPELKEFLEYLIEQYGEI